MSSLGSGQRLAQALQGTRRGTLRGRPLARALHPNLRPHKPHAENADITVHRTCQGLPERASLKRHHVNTALRPGVDQLITQ